MGAQLVGGTLGALGIWALFTQTGVDMGLGQASFNEDTYTWGSRSSPSSSVPRS